MLRIGDNLDLFLRAAAFALLVGVIVVSLASAAAAAEGIPVSTTSASVPVLIALAAIAGASLLALSRAHQPTALRARTGRGTDRSVAFEQSDLGRRAGRLTSAVDPASKGFRRFYRGETEQPRG